MSIWINKIPLAAALMALAACLPFGAEQDKGVVSRFEGPPPSRMAVAGGHVVIAGPKGYCIDRDASQDSGGKSALVVLASCRGMGASGFGSDPAKAAVLTVGVAPAPGEILVGPAAPDLTRFFQSPKGLATLSRIGKPETVTFHEAFATATAYHMYLTDNAAFDWGSVQPDYWRALLPLGGRMVTLSVLALPDAKLSRADGLKLLQEFIEATRKSTPEKAAI